MSGGHFNYQQNDIDDIVASVKMIIARADKYDFEKEETLLRIKEGLHYLEMAAIYAQRIDWLVSGDDGDDSFLKRLNEDILEYEVARKKDGYISNDIYDPYDLGDD